MTRSTWLLLTVLLLGRPLYLLPRGLGATYYVDATAGNDANDGLSPGQAWQTLAKVSGETYSADDAILFQRGEIWRESLTISSAGSSGHPITYGAYGTGQRPVFAGSDLIGTWSDEGGNVWSATLTTDPDIVFLDGHYGKEEASSEDLDAEYDWTWNSNVLYIYATSDPDTGYTDPGIEATIRDKVVYDNFAAHGYITLQNLEIRHAANYGVHVPYCDYWILEDCFIHDCGNREGSTDDCIAFVENADHNTVRRCEIARGGSHGIYTYGGHNNVYEENRVYDCDHCNIDAHWNTGGTADTVIRYNCCYFTGAFVDTGPGANAIFVRGTGGNQATGTKIYGNVLWNDHASDHRALHIYQDTNDTHVYNNTWYDLFAELDTAGGSVTLRNNVGSRSSGYVLRALLQTNITVNYNVWDTGSGTLIRVDSLTGGDGPDFTEAEWSAYRSESGWDANSTNAAPSFTNAGSHEFSLAADSPCIDAGTDLGASYDDALDPDSTWPAAVATVDQDDYGTAWEIGAYAWIPSGGNGGAQSSAAGWFASHLASRWISCRAAALWRAP